MRLRLACLLLLLGSCAQERSGAGESRAEPARGAAEAVESVVSAETSEPQTIADVPEAGSPGAAEPRAEVGFLGLDDDAVLASLREGEITAIERGRGGRSLGFKITLADGSRGYFKPEQSFSGAHWYSEIAAYHLDRALGLGRVPAVTGRSLEWRPLRRAARGDRRTGEVRVVDGRVRGAFVAWVEGGLSALHLPDGWERWIRVQALLPISPYQRPAVLRAELRHGPSHAQHTPGAPDRPSRPTELSDLIVFDYLISNVDRWGGNFTNVRVRDTDSELVYLDNGAGFWPNARLGLMDRRLHALSRFRRSTVQALRDFDLDDFRSRLESDPLAPVLDPSLVDGVEERRVEVLRHVDEMIERYGEERVFFD